MLYYYLANCYKAIRIAMLYFKIELTNKQKYKKYYLGSFSKTKKNITNLMTLFLAHPVLLYMRYIVLNVLLLHTVYIYLCLYLSVSFFYLESLGNV